MALILPPIQQNRGLDLNQLIAGLIQQGGRRQESEKIAQAQRLVQNTRDLAGQFQSIMDVEDFDLKRRSLSRLGQELIKSGDEKGFEIVKDALALDNNDDLRVFLARNVARGIAVTDQVVYCSKPYQNHRKTLHNQDKTL